MEFLYTYVWGAESFPYEVREQYGVLTFGEYRASIGRWLGEPPPLWVDLPPGEGCYLQDGYRRGLAGKVQLRDGQGRPVELPCSNCILVWEKPLS